MTGQQHRNRSPGGLVKQDESRGARLQRMNGQENKCQLGELTGLELHFEGTHRVMSVSITSTAPEACQS